MSVTVRITETTDVMVDAAYGDDPAALVAKALAKRPAEPGHRDATVLDDHFDGPIPYSTGKPGKATK